MTHHAPPDDGAGLIIHRLPTRQEDTMAGHAVSRDYTLDEHGERRFGWWCDACERGGFAPDPETREEEVREHVAS